MNKPTARPFSWVNPKVEIRQTSKYGRGVFAKDALLKGETIMVMGGYICHTDEENELGTFATNYNMDISDDWSFCPTKEEDLDLMPQHLINHSCEPNSGFSEQNFIVAIRDINPGEEIGYDYAFVMWSSEESDYHYELECLCGTPSCRKVITENDWKLPALQESYGSYFQPFLRNKFNRN